MSGSGVHTSVARFVAVSRIFFGGTLLVFPKAIQILWGDHEGKPTVQMSIRALGARDLILGLGVEATLRDDSRAARRWILSSAAVDAADVVSMMLAFAHLPPRRRYAVIAASALSAAAGFWAAAGRDSADGGGSVTRIQGESDGGPQGSTTPG